MRKSDRHVLKITTAAVFIALTTALTLAVRIPSPTHGYMNLGDIAVLFSGFLLGPLYGPAAGGLGSALADLLAGYPVYVPGTLLIKALMALIVALLPKKLSGPGGKHPRVAWIVSSILAELTMVAGYYLYEAAIVGLGFAGAFAGVSGNVMQGILGAAGACFLVEILSRTRIFRLYGSDTFL